MHLPKLTVNSLDFMYFLLLRARYEFNLHGLTITLPERSKLITVLQIFGRKLNQYEIQKCTASLFAS